MIILNIVSSIIIFLLFFVNLHFLWWVYNLESFLISLIISLLMLLILSLICKKIKYKIQFNNNTFKDLNMSLYMYTVILIYSMFFFFVNSFIIFLLDSIVRTTIDMNWAWFLSLYIYIWLFIISLFSLVCFLILSNVHKRYLKKYQNIFSITSSNHILINSKLTWTYFYELLWIYWIFFTIVIIWSIF